MLIKNQSNREADSGARGEWRKLIGVYILLCSFAMNMFFTVYGLKLIGTLYSSSKFKVRTVEFTSEKEKK